MPVDESVSWRRTASQGRLGKYQPWASNYRRSKKKFEENAERQSSWQRRNNSRNVESRHQQTKQTTSADKANRWFVSNWATRLIIENLGQRNCTIRLEEEYNLDHCEERQSNNLLQLKECLPPISGKQITWKNPHWQAVDEKLRPEHSEQAGFRKGRGILPYKSASCVTSLNRMFKGWQAYMSTSWIFNKPLTVLPVKEFVKYYEVTVFQKRLYALLGTGTTTVKVQSSMKEASQTGLKSPLALSKVVRCQDLSSSLYLTG